MILYYLNIFYLLGKEARGLKRWKNGDLMLKSRFISAKCLKGVNKVLTVLLVHTFVTSPSKGFSALFHVLNLSIETWKYDFLSEHHDRTEETGPKVTPIGSTLQNGDLQPLMLLLIQNGMERSWDAYLKSY